MDKVQEVEVALRKTQRQLRVIFKQTFQPGSLGKEAKGLMGTGE